MGSIYLTTDCPVTPAGCVDADLFGLGPKSISWENSGLNPEIVYLVVDTFDDWTGDYGDFFLIVDVE